MKIEKSNTIGLGRFIACILVIFSHAFPLSTGDGRDLLWNITGCKLSFGGLAVSYFLFFSGFLVTKSLLYDTDLLSFSLKRIKRIFPPLIFVVCVSAFVLGPLVTQLDLSEYYRDSDTYLYTLNGICILVHDLPGVFENNIYGTTVNGALWTMPVEVLCYIACMIGYKLRLLDKKRFGIISVIALIAWCTLSFLNTEYNSIALAFLMYCMGILAYLFFDQVILRSWIAAILAILLVLCVKTPLFYTVYAIAFPYIMIWIVWGIKLKIPGKLGNLGELSYATYLCGFPIQQTVVFLCGGEMDPIINFLVSCPLAIITGFVIHICIERPFIKIDDSGNGNNNK